MSMGQSAGRSNAASTRPQARRRLTQDERAQTTALHDDPEVWPDTEDLDEYRYRLVMWLSLRWLALLLTALGVVGTVTSSGWWLLLGLGAAGGHVLLELVRPTPPRLRLWPQKRRTF